ncbi:MAG: hypothetical protein ACRD2X_21545 [Vicinamibacteraceae bacterium]
MKNETMARTRVMVTAASLRLWIVHWLTWAAGLIVVAMSWSSWQPSGAPPYEDILPTGTLLWLCLAVWSLLGAVLTATARSRGDSVEGPAGRGWNTSFALVAGAVLTTAYLWMVLPHVERYFFLVDDFAIAGESGQHTIGRLVSAPLFGFYRPLTDIAARFQYAWFGWELPSGYAAVSLALHVANAIGVWWIASRLRFSAPAQIVSGVTFLLAPWAAEGYLWFAVECDLLATTGLLGAFISGLAALQAASRRRSAAWMAIGGASALVAAFAKETGVLAPVEFLVLGLLATRGGARPWGRYGAYSAVLFAVAVIYVTVRAQVFSVMGGAYGDFFSLFEPSAVLGNLGHALFAFAVTPLPYERAEAVSFVLLGSQMLTLLIVLPLGALLTLRRHPGTTVGLALLVGGTLVPVLWYEILATTLVPRRFLYTAGIWWALWLGLALGELARRPSRPGRATFAVALVVCGTYWIASVHHQVSLWREATRLSRAVIVQFGRELARGSQPLYLTNLPFMFDTGPYMLVPYAFHYYYREREVPPLIARRVYLGYRHGRVYLVHRDPVPSELANARGTFRNVTFVLPRVSQESSP